jgi:hypothetical protein
VPLSPVMFRPLPATGRVTRRTCSKAAQIKDRAADDLLHWTSAEECTFQTSRKLTLVISTQCALSECTRTPLEKAPEKSTQISICQIVVGFTIAIAQNEWLFMRTYLAKSESAGLGNLLLVIHLLAADDSGEKIVPCHYSLGCGGSQPADLGNDSTCQLAKRCPHEALSRAKPD